MSFTRPTLSGLRQQSRGYFTARIPGADLTLRRSVLAVIADLVSALVNGLYGYLDWIATQILPDRCNEDYLLRWATIFKVPRIAGTKSAGNVVFTGLNGKTIKAGTIVQAAAAPGYQFQTQYQTSADATVGENGSVTTAVIALTVGAAANLTEGYIVSLTSAIAGVDAVATVAVDGLTGGTDQEPLEDWRARVLARIQEPPQGGTIGDYEQWAKSVSGVTRAWVYPLHRGEGTVDVSFVMDGRSNIIPLTADVAAVQAAINTLKPVTDDCVAFAPTAHPLPLTLSSLAPDTGDTRAAVQAAWNDLLKTDAIPGGGLSFQDQIVPAIAGAAGVSGFTISSPNADVYGIAGTLYTPGTVSFSN